MEKFCRHILLILCSVLFVAGCSQEPRSDSPVLARVGDSVITHDDYIREISRVPEWARSNFKDLDGKGKFLDELVKKELVYQYAKKMRMQNDREYLDKVEEFKKMTLVTMILKKEVEEKTVLDDEMVKAFYDENSDKFRIGTEIKASHILVKTEDEAKDVAARLEKGTSFADLAKTLSIDKASGQKGGDLGYFGRGKMVPEFERAVLNLKPGEISNPVSTRFGYHIIRLDDIKEGKLASFEQSAESIRRQIAAEKQKALFDSFVDKLKADTEISKEIEALASISLPWDTTEAAAPDPAVQPETEEAK
ncbi:MAG: peptidylprolyl isomerase [Nitrospiraceae bacterium]|nr:MAG: peptidylprolyl isomerase [Nitrospiraceae bacterium]